MTTVKIEQQERVAQFVWMGFILAFFGLQAVLWTCAIALTSGDSSHSVIANYDQQALMWDETRAAQRASDSLGWEVAISIGSKADVMSGRVVEFSVLDSSGDPIEGAVFDLKAFHCAKSALVQPIEVISSADGVYIGKIRANQSGLWEISGEITRGSDVRLVKRRIKINAPVGS